MTSISIPILAGALATLLAAPAVPYAPDDPDPANTKKVVRELTFPAARDLIFADPNALDAKVEDLRVRETDTEIRLELAADVLFAFDKADVRPEAGEALARALEVVKGKAKGTVRIEGHTDGKGAKAYNDALSLRRARSVEAWLEKNGLTGVRFETRGFGASKPIAPNANADGSDDPIGRARNRRVEIVLRKAG